MKNNEKPYFLNMRTWNEFPFYKRVFWRMFGKKITGSNDSYSVVAYTLFNITYIHKFDIIE